MPEHHGFPGLPIYSLPSELGPVSLSEYQEFRASLNPRGQGIEGIQPLPDELVPILRPPGEAKMLSWSILASSQEAQAFLDDLSHRIGLTSKDPGPGRPAKLDDQDALERLAGELILHAARERWSGAMMRASAFTDLPVGHAVAKRILDLLEGHGFARRLRGYRDQTTGKGQATKLQTTPHLLGLARDHGIILEEAKRHFAPLEVRDDKAKNREPVRVKEPRKGTQRTTLATAEAKAIRAKVKAFNAFVAGHSITSDRAGSVLEHHPAFQRLYIGGLDGHGRLYDKAPSYQSLPGSERATLRINGEATVELDVKASGLTVAHGLAGVPMPSRSDPYALPRYPGIPREAVKDWIVVFLGGGGKHWGRWSEGFQAIPGHPDLKPRDVRGPILETFPWLQDLPALLDLPLGSKDIMHRLSWHESEAVLGAVWALQDQGILALPVHDSLMVQARHKAQARAALEASFQARLGVLPLLDTKTPKPRSQETTR